MSKLTIALTAALALASLTGCKKEPESAPAPAKPAKSTDTTPAQPADKKGETAKPETKTETKGAEPTQETAEGAAKLFAAAMASGDFMRASELTDPTCEGRGKLEELVLLLDDAKKKGGEAEMVVGFLTATFSKPWQGAKAAISAQEGRNARCRYTLASNDTRDVTLQNTDGKWYVFATEEVMAVSKTQAEQMAPDKAPPANPTTPPAGTQPEQPQK